MTVGIITILAALIPVLAKVFMDKYTAANTPKALREDVDNEINKTIVTRDITGVNRLVDSLLQK